MISVTRKGKLQINAATVLIGQGNGGMILFRLMMS